MYLIIEKSDNNVYSYFESKKVFKKNQVERSNLTRIEPKELNNQCDLSLYGDNIYMIIPVKR